MDESVEYPPAGSGASDAHHEPGAAPDTVAIDSLKFGTSPRRSIVEDPDHIRRLVEMDVEFPPILVHRETLRVIDGRHRLRAAQQKGEKRIKVIFFDGSEADAFIRAVAENIAHGLPLTIVDRKAAALRIMSSHAHLSDRAIASYTGLAAKTVARIRERSSREIPQSNARLGADRRLRPLDASGGRLCASQLILDRPDAPLREIARGAGVSLGTAHDVRRRMRLGEDPVPTGRRRAVRSARQPPPASEQTGGRVTRSVSPSVTLRKLAEDPALRLTEKGRELLCLLRARTVTVNDLIHLVDAVPAHRAETIAQYARECARSWETFARSIAVVDGVPDQGGQNA